MRVLARQGTSPEARAGGRRFRVQRTKKAREIGQTALEQIGLIFAEAVARRGQNDETRITREVWRERANIDASRRGWLIPKNDAELEVITLDVAEHGEVADRARRSAREPRGEQGESEQRAADPAGRGMTR